MNEIIPGLWLGGLSESWDEKAFKECGITAVLNCAFDIKPKF